jgi:hypothetical protein
VCLGTTEGPRGTEERLHHNARKLCQIFSSRSTFCRTTAWLALRESVEEMIQTIENDGLLQRMAREMSSARVFRCRDQPLALPRAAPIP